MTNPGLQLSGKIALVTGGSRGIGRAICAVLAECQATVLFTYRSNPQAAEETMELLRKAGATGRMYQVDVSRAEDIARLAASVQSDVGDIDILVNNAGINADGLMLSLEPEKFERVLSVNLGGVYNLTRTFARGMMMKRWGRIINLSSISGGWGGRGKSNYAASKAAINGFTRACAIELASKGITVNAIAPGMIVTELTETVRGLTKDSLLDRIPVRRYGQPEDVAWLAAFLASERSAYMTGQVLTIDGGLTVC